MMTTQTPVSSMLMQDAEREERKRLARIAQSWKAYNNQSDDPLKTTELDPKGQDNTKINLARKSVNTSAFYLFGKGLDFEIDEDAAADDSPAEKWLEQCWKSQHQGMIPFLLELAQGAGIEGHAFVRLHLPEPGEQYPRLAPVSAEMVRAVCDPADFTRVRRYVIQWTSIDEDLKKPVAFRHTIQRGDVDGRWLIVEERSVGDTPRWVEDKRLIWPYAWCPLFQCKNLPWPQSFYGASDIEEDVLRLGDAINFVASNINRILRAYGHPFDYVIGQRLDAVERGIGAMPYFPNPEARIERLEEVQNLGAADEQFRRLRDAYNELTSLPEIASGKVENIGQLSGLALQILYGPLTAMIQTKREFYEPMIQGICKALLEIGKFEVKEVTLKWPTILPTNRKEEAETAAALHDAGVSQSTALQEMGYDPEVEAQKRNQEGQDAAAIAAKLFDRGGLPSSGGGEGGSTGGGN